MLQQLAAILKKEFLLLARDIHGLLLLFLMPAVFIVVMSLAMQHNFAAQSQVKLGVIVHDQAANEDSAILLDSLRKAEVFDFTVFGEEAESGELQRRIRLDQAAFLMTIAPITETDTGNTLAVELVVAPATSKQTEVIFAAAVREALRGVKVEKMLSDLEGSSVGGGESVDDLAAVDLSVEYAYGQQGEAPTAVQQNVPAWLVFAMFFVVVPLSNTLIKERQMGTLRRLRTFAVPGSLLVAGKLIPYFVIMQLQVLVMLLLGMYLVPILGGDSLTVNGSVAALMLMAVTIAIAALGYALLIAVVTKTTEQATTLGGAGNIILAALGGIMVPTFVMPPMMREISRFSPMNWGLEGFLDVFLRDGTLALVWPKALALTLLGIVLIVTAFLMLIKGRSSQ